MPNGGELILRTENLHFDKVFIKSKPDIVSVYYIKVTVADDGFGMSKEVCEHVFEPFFTTKEEGKGTGLGLATVYGIVKNHGGYIDVSSEPCKGTIFTLYFPVSEKKVIEIKKDTTFIKGSATILVIYDEEIVINLAKKMLRNLGYKVLIADDSGKGLEIFKEKKDIIDLVLLDMIMPNLDGKETFMRLREINPSVKILLTSGNSKNSKVAEILKKGAQGFIQKPYIMQELSNIISETLNKSNS